MHYKIRYHNKPHDLKLSGIHIVPMARGVWWVICELNLRGFEINSWGGSCHPLSEGLKGINFSVYFGDDKDIRAELIIYPDTPEEAEMSMITGNIFKHTYHGMMVSKKCLHKKWDEYCGKKSKKV